MARIQTDLEGTVLLTEQTLRKLNNAVGDAKSRGLQVANVKSNFSHVMFSISLDLAGTQESVGYKLQVPAVKPNLAEAKRLGSSTR